MTRWATNRGKGQGIKFLREHMADADGPCLIWPFYRDPLTGRGSLGYNGELWLAHRLMLTLVKGPAPADKPQTAHSCGKGHEGCVHPVHLSWSDQFENQQDRRKHGTAVTTRTGNRSKLTLEQIAQIRSLKDKQTQSETARQFGISNSNVRYWQGERDKVRTTPPRSIFSLQPQRI